MRLPILTALLAAALLAPVKAEEGMWTFDNLPLKALKEKYQFEPSQDWISHVRQSIVHQGGCTGSFVSANGLVLTNHHCIRGYVNRLSTAEKNLLKDGFVAPTQADELKIPGVTFRVLQTMENITDQLQKAVKTGLSEKEADLIRTKAIQSIQEALEKKDGFKYTAVTLYHGGETWLYGYKEFKDIRLVMAPELDIAMFGGDFDNFTYPRHNLDFGLLRIYENDKPYQTPHHLDWSKAGDLKAGDLTFVVGHPGRTQRLQTYAQMVFDRDISLPASIESLTRTRQIIEEYAGTSAEAARQVQAQILNISNGLKANEGALTGLKDAEAMSRIEAQEKALKTAVNKDAKLKTTTGGSWKRVEDALKLQKGLLKDALHVGNLRSPNLGMAIAMIRYARQMDKPVKNRLPEYQDEADLKRMTEAWLRDNPGPRTPELEQLQIRRSLEDAQKALGRVHPFIKAAGSPDKAVQALKESQLEQKNVRKKLVEGGSKTILESQDPLLVMAKKLEGMIFNLNQKQKDIRAIISEHGARIAKARFAVYGKTLAPDATSSLRITYGPVATYPANGTLVQPFTTLFGLYDRHEGWGGNTAKGMNGEWALPQRWLDRQKDINLKTPFNFSCMGDTIGGNSGSPVINKKGEVVGLLFDGNIESLAGRYYYDEKVNRSICVDARAIVEALNNVYDGKHLVKEIFGE